MSRQLWGEGNCEKKTDYEVKIIPVSAKKAKLDEMQCRSTMCPAADKNVIVKVKNPLVTQTIEVMKQTEMLQSLIDTYSNKSGSSNYLLNPCQMIPEVDFPPENAADFVSDEKFAKPIWFIPPMDTRFARRVTCHYPQINLEACRASLRKAVCGQLRVAGFTDIADSALVLFADAIEEFVRNLMLQIREVNANSKAQCVDTSTEIAIESIEKAYYALTNASLTQVHNYFKHHLVARNRSEISEFNGVLQEYDKLMKESQSMQKEEFQEGDFLNILEMPQSNEGTAVAMAIGGVVGGGGALQDMGGSGATMLSILEGRQHMSVQHLE